MMHLLPRTVPGRRAARVGSVLSVRADVLGLLLILCAGPASAQSVTWEPFAVFPYLGERGHNFYALGFLYGEGPQADDPAADTLVAFSNQGVFLYNPSGAAGAAGDNGDYGDWHRLCQQSICISETDGLVTAAQSFVTGSPAGPTQFCRATHRGRRWVCNVEPGIAAFPIFESTLPVLAGPDGTPALIVGTADNGAMRRSVAEGQPGTWHYFGGRDTGFPQVIGEVPPSPALPRGRILSGVWNGILYSSDPGDNPRVDSTVTFTRSNAYGNAVYIVWSFAFRPVAGHSYGGVALAGVSDIAYGGEIGGATVLASGDGGVTWTTKHRFTAAELDLPVYPGEGYDVDVTTVRSLFVAPDGAIWAGVDFNTGASSPARGGIARSTDGGATWQRADGGFRDATGRGYGVNQFKLSRDGTTLYAATTYGVWRTTDVAVASEAPPAVEAPRLGVAVRPNPALGGRVSVVVTSASAEAVRVVVVDARGREVAVVLDGSVSGERVVSLDTSSLAPGVYVVRASAAEETATARLVVAR